jgi:hypothetical protein
MFNIFIGNINVTDKTELNVIQTSYPDMHV